MNVFYLASPYTHPDPLVRDERYRAAKQATEYLIQQGLCVFSPIAYCHCLSLHGKLGGDWTAWRDFDKSFLSRCDELLILIIPGWRHSVGVRAEISFARAFHKPIHFAFVNEKPDYNVQLGNVIKAETLEYELLEEMLSI